MTTRDPRPSVHTHTATVPARPEPRHDPSGPAEAPGIMPPDPFPPVGPLPTDPPPNGPPFTDPPLIEPRRIDPQPRRELEPA